MSDDLSEKFLDLEFIPCAHDGCERPARWRDMCPTHASRQQYNTEPNVIDDSPRGICAVSHCIREANARTAGAMCESHYQLRYRGKDPENHVLDALPERACWVSDCTRRSETKGLCHHHYGRARAGTLQVPAHLGVEVAPPCSFDGCDRPTRAKGLCHSHYSQIQRGEELRSLRTYGAYVEAVSCLIPQCRRVVVSDRLCSTHKGKQTKYGLTVEGIVELAAVQQCENPGCTETVRLHIDHDHETGIVRGVLCNGCNTALGMLKEDGARIAGLSEYLSTNRSTLRSVA